MESYIDDQCPGLQKGQLALAVYIIATAFQARKPTQSNFVHNRNASILALLVEFLHGRRDVASSDDMLLLPDGGLDDSGMEGVGDQANDKVVLGDLGVQGVRIGDIERDGSGILYAGRKGFGRFQSPAGCRALVNLPIRLVSRF